MLAAHDAATADPKRGRKPNSTRPDRLRNKKLGRENARLRIRLPHAQAIFEA